MTTNTSIMQHFTTSYISHLTIISAPPFFHTHPFPFDIIKPLPLTHLTFGYHSTPVGSLPPLTHLTFGFDFHPIEYTSILSPPSHFTLEFNNNGKSEDFLPPILANLIHSNSTCHPNDDLPSTLTLANFTPRKINDNINGNSIIVSDDLIMLEEKNKEGLKGIKLQLKILGSTVTFTLIHHNNSVEVLLRSLSDAHVCFIIDYQLRKFRFLVESTAASTSHNQANRKDRINKRCDITGYKWCQISC